MITGREGTEMVERETERHIHTYMIHPQPYTQIYTYTHSYTHGLHTGFRERQSRDGVAKREVIRERERDVEEERNRERVTAGDERDTWEREGKAHGMVRERQRSKQSS